jgi:hypothetical protein
VLSDGRGGWERGRLRRRIGQSAKCASNYQGDHLQGPSSPRLFCPLNKFVVHFFISFSFQDKDEYRVGMALFDILLARVRFRLRKRCALDRSDSGNVTRGGNFVPTGYKNWTRLRFSTAPQVVSYHGGVWENWSGRRNS